MARRTMFATLVVMVVAAAALIEGTAAAVHIVGDATGWTIPAGGAAFYSTWAANKTFAVGDILVFNFASGAHDVAKVTKTSYDSCSSANPISLQATAPVNITLTTSGDHYFICTIGQHCASGQKLSVNIPTAAGSPTPTPSPSPAPPTASPTPTPTPPPTPSPTPTPSTAPTPPPAAHSPTPSPAPPTSPPTESPPPPPGSPASEPPSPGESTSPPPPPPSSAPHKAAAAFGVAVMSIAVAALF